MSHPDLLTPRLLLRSPAPEDQPFLRALAADPDVRRYLGGVASKPAQDAAIRACLAPDKDSASWLVVTRTDEHPVGLVSLSPHVDGEDTELSYQFDPASWGNGYAREAIMAVIGFVRHNMALPRIIAETQTANLRSRHLLQKAGMTSLRSTMRFGAAQIIYVASFTLRNDAPADPPQN